MSNKFGIRLLAFFRKEFNEIRRQPWLVLSLIFGPLLILLVFGLGYRGERPELRTALVVPPAMLGTEQLDRLTRSMETNFTLVSIDSDEEAAMARLTTHDVDVVEILPADLEERVLRGERALVEFHYDEVNPFMEQWIQYLGYAQVNELNNAILRESTRQLQQEASRANDELSSMRQRLVSLREDVDSISAEEFEQSVRTLRSAADVLVVSPLLTSQLDAENSEAGQVQQQLLDLYQNLTTIDQALQDETLDQEIDQLDVAQGRIQELEDATAWISTASVEAIVSPLQRDYYNLFGTPPDSMVFYAPGVLALVLQHIAITLGALSLVRERLLGAIEFYGVAPIQLTQVLLGKYLAYTLFICIISTVLLIILATALQIPFSGSLIVFFLFLICFTVASLGIGFIISALSTSDSQAIQLSMLILLISLFFSGFFLPLENFYAFVRTISQFIPLTHAVIGFQTIMLRGDMPSVSAWAILMAIASIAFLIVLLIWRRQFRFIE
ncbi:MAG: ABC transporter permease [Chloroflexota bacterium]